MAMRDDVRLDVTARLIADYKMVRDGDWLRRGVCPQCGHKDLFASAQSPWAVKCGRLNKCGWQAHTKDLFPDAFGQFNERYPATSAQPNATAEAYLDFVRGFAPAAVQGWYRQGAFRHPRGDRATATVLFDVAPGVWMERLIDVVRVTTADGEVEERKANFHGSHGGLWWAPPPLAVDTLGPGDELWLVEGCLDAIALTLAGVQAVATLSSANYPGKALGRLPKGVVLVWALDNDKAGKDGMRRHIERARKDGFECRAALVPQRGPKRDWNDLWLSGDLAPDDRAATLDRCRYLGDLLLAENPLDKGLLIWRRHPSAGFGIDFGKRTYWWSLPQEMYMQCVALLMADGSAEVEAKEEAAKRCAQVREIANCVVTFLYFQENRTIDEAWYYSRIEFPSGKNERRNTFSGNQISTASEFKKRLLSIAPGALYTGTGEQLNWIVSRHLRDIRSVETVDFIGYSKEHQTYVFPSVAVSKGRTIPLNTEDFFEVDKGVSLKSLNTSLHLHIGRRAEYRPEWTDLLYQAYGPKGIIAAAFFLGSLVAEQIRDTWKSYPFLEIVGEAGSGKSTLIEFLWKLVGRQDYEGFDPNKSTLAARARIMSQVSNLPISLIESDREDVAKQRQFDWDELKTAYNGRASRARGVRNGGNETWEPPFRGSILISQNAAVSASDAILQRIIHLNFDTAGHSRTSKIAADALAALPVEAVSHWLIMATTAERKILDKLKARTPIHEDALLALPEVRSNRLAKNHAQLMALVEALADLVDLPAGQVDATLAVLRTSTVTRQQAIASDHPMVEEFWELIDYLGISMVNHSRNHDLLAINLNMVVAMAGRAGQSMPPLQDLKRYLKSSRTRRFIGIKTVNSGLTEFLDRSVKCWVFNGGKS